MLYVQLTSRFPFRGKSDMLTFENIQKRNIVWPETGLDPDAKDLIDKLLQINPDDRIGSESFDEIKSHPFFNGIEWDKLNDQTPPDIKQGVLPTWKEDLNEISYTFLKLPPQLEASLRDSEEIDNKSNSDKNDSDNSFRDVLHENEKIIVQGLVTKKRKLSVKTRLLALTNEPRFIYIDSRTLQMKGQIVFDNSTDIKVIKQGLFDIITPGRAYHFTDLDTNTDKWVSGVAKAHQIFKEKNTK